jgi:hypothetical protein
MKRIIEKRSNEAVVRFWPQLYACLSIVCPRCISCHPQLAQLSSVVTERSERKLAPVNHVLNGIHVFAHLIFFEVLLPPFVKTKENTIQNLNLYLRHKSAG